MRRSVQLVASLTITGLVLALAVVSQGVAAPSPSTHAAVAAKRSGGGSQQFAKFNVPRRWGTKKQQNSIVNTVVHAINHVPGRSKKHPNPRITIATYLLDSTTSVNAIINACRRGVGVRMIIDAKINNKNSRRLVSALNGDNVKDKNHDGKPDSKPKTGPCGRSLKKKGSGRAMTDGVRVLKKSVANSTLGQPTSASVTWGKDRSYVKKCSGSCGNAGKGGNMHAKFYLFSSTGSHHKVVMVSSSNLNRGGEKNGWNDLYVMNHRPKSYEFYLKEHRLMTRQIRTGKTEVKVKDGPFVSRFFPMRGAGKKNDPTMKDLRAIKCHGPLGRTSLNISMFYWAGKRGNYIASKLLNMARSGCQVNVIYGAPSRAIAQRLRTAAGRGLINLYDSRWDFNDDGYNEIRTHAKFVAVKGVYRDHKKAHLVFTGSQNWVMGSLRLGDENTITIQLASAYREYMHEWRVIRAHSRRLPYN